jgi:hypothetical protein
MKPKSPALHRHLLYGSSLASESRALHWWLTEQSQGGLRELQDVMLTSSYRPEEVPDMASMLRNTTMPNVSLTEAPP